MKTIYLLHARTDAHLGGFQSGPFEGLRPRRFDNLRTGFMVAFECRECAEIQAAWYRRDKVMATVAKVQLFDSIRDGVMNECKHLQLHHSEHEHVPATMGARKGDFHVD